jgi:hypothetical protein
MDAVGSRNFSVILLPLAKISNQIEGDAQSLLSMPGIATGKAKNGDDSLPVRGL